MSSCSFCGRDSDGTWPPSKCKHCGEVFCPYHSFSEDHECGVRRAEQDVDSGQHRERSPRSKRLITIGFITVIILILSTFGAAYVLPATQSVFRGLNHSSFTMSLQNATSDSSNSTYSTTIATDQYVSTASSTAGFFTTSYSTTTPQQLSIDGAWVSFFISVMDDGREQKGLSNLTYAPVLSLPRRDSTRWSQIIRSATMDTVLISSSILPAEPLSRSRKSSFRLVFHLPHS